jgi:hypothetical protein
MEKLRLIVTGDDILPRIDDFLARDRTSEYGYREPAPSATESKR